MEAKTNPNGTEPIETATPARMNDAAGLAGLLCHSLPPAPG
jgi:hypothetical protein